MSLAVRRIILMQISFPASRVLISTFVYQSWMKIAGEKRGNSNQRKIEYQIFGDCDSEEAGALYRGVRRHNMRCEVLRGERNDTPAES